MSGAFMVWPCAVRREAKATDAYESQAAARTLWLDLGLSGDVGEEPFDRMFEFLHCSAEARLVSKDKNENSAHDGAEFSMVCAYQKRNFRPTCRLRGLVGDFWVTCPKVPEVGVRFRPFTPPGLPICAQLGWLTKL